MIIWNTHKQKRNKTKNKPYENYGFPSCRLLNLSDLKDILKITYGNSNFGVETQLRARNAPVDHALDIAQTISKLSWLLRTHLTLLRMQRSAVVVAAHLTRDAFRPCELVWDPSFFYVSNFFHMGQNYDVVNPQVLSHVVRTTTPVLFYFFQKDIAFIRNRSTRTSHSTVLGSTWKNDYGARSAARPSGERVYV
ncbi:hypothetical protein EVAR_19372_1 [Eumeta japonica]|uniref:Uncharacterized protein n=1 Tax=Eumeta variegata TaxID=151549 RepID=A0A4C1TRG5_EUMVA|nr:hypothetical protein EVAR_19372_1 [Eumeta japonica]